MNVYWKLIIVILKQLAQTLQEVILVLVIVDIQEMGLIVKVLLFTTKKRSMMLTFPNRYKRM